MLHLRLKAARIAKELTQAQVGERLSVPQNFISKLERGEKKPSVELLDKLAKLYDVSVTSLIDGPDEPYKAAVPALDARAPVGLHELAEDEALIKALRISAREWVALRSLRAPDDLTKDGYVAVLYALRNGRARDTE
jgi:transcriptional regulator with XRE-family HTH domain